MKKIIITIICLMFGFSVGFFALAGIEECKLNTRRKERKQREEAMRREIDKMIDLVNSRPMKVKA